jgi:DNA replication protein DnaC
MADYKLTRTNQPELPIEEPEQKQPGQAVCPTCKGAGYYIIDDPESIQPGVLHICKCTAKRQEQRRQEQAAAFAAHLAEELGGQLADCTFGNFDTEWPAEDKHRKVLRAASAFASAYAQQPSGWLLLHGKNFGYCGTGKSHLAAAIASRARKDGREVAYATMPDLFGYILSDWNKAEARIEALSTVSLLVMDDMGQEHVSGNGVRQFQEKIFRILNTRSRKQLPTVFTSNYTLDELERLEHYSPAIVSRLAGECQRRIIPMLLPDYRRKK